MDFSHVNFWGLIVMLAGLALSLAAVRVKAALFPNKADTFVMAIRLVALLIVMLGTLITMKII